MDMFQKRKGLVRLNRQIQIQNQAAVIRALKLRRRHFELSVKLVDHGALLSLQFHVAGFRPIMQEQKQVQHRRLVVLQITGDCPVVALFCRIVGKERMRHRIVHARDSGKIGRADFIAQAAAVHDFHTCKAACTLDLGTSGQILQ